MSLASPSAATPSKSVLVSDILFAMLWNFTEAWFALTLMSPVSYSSVWATPLTSSYVRSHSSFGSFLISTTSTCFPPSTVMVLHESPLRAIFPGYFFSYADLRTARYDVATRFCVFLNASTRCLRATTRISPSFSATTLPKRSGKSGAISMTRS